MHLYLTPFDLRHAFDDITSKTVALIRFPKAKSLRPDGNVIRVSASNLKLKRHVLHFESEVEKE